MPSRKPAATAASATARRGRRSPRTRRGSGRRPVPFVALTAAAVATATATATGLLTPHPARAQTIHDYTGSTGTASAPSNGLFSTGFSPALTTGSITTLLRFGGGSYTATNNLTSDLIVNGLTFTNTGAVVLGRGGAANAANRLVLDGSDPTVTLNNIGSLRIALDLLLNATARFTGDGSATLSGVLSGSRGFTKTGSGTLRLTGTGSSIGGVAIFNGGTTLINGLTADSYATLSTGAGEIGRDAGTVATVTVSGTDGNGNASAWSTDTGQLLVGTSGTGTLNVQNGGRVSSAFVNLGVFAGSSGTATVSGSGSSLTTGANPLYIGFEGTGTLNILDGGSVTSGRVEVGFSAGFSSTATVSGPGSSLDTGANRLSVGPSGAGTLNILDGGSVTSGRVEVGNTAASSGTATVSGSGSSLTTGASGLLLAFRGTGALRILDGGSFTTTGETLLAFESGSSASLIVNGGRFTADRLRVGSGMVSAFKLTNPAAANGGGYALTLGGNNGSSTIGAVIADASAGEGGAAGIGGAGGIRKVGTGTLTLNAANTFSGGMLIDGGRVTVGNEFALQNSTVTLNVNNGLNLNGLARVTLGGLEGTGALDVSNTALTVGGNNASTTYGGILSGDGLIRSSRLDKVGTGTLRLTGIGSSIYGSAYFSGGTTLITGATAGSYASLTTLASYIGNDAGTVATVTVSGTDGNGNASTWGRSQSLLLIGVYGTGTLNILDGGRVSGGSFSLGSFAGSSGTLTVSGAGSSLTTGVGSSFEVGVGGTGTLNILGGGSVTSGRLEVGNGSTATVSGSGSSLNTGTQWLTVGESGTGTLNILDGGSVIGGAVDLGTSTGSSSGTVTVSGSGSSLTIGADGLTLGVRGMGALRILDGGSVSTTGRTFLTFSPNSSGSLIVNGGRFTAGQFEIGQGTVSAFKLTNPTAANGGGYALTLGGNSNSVIGAVIADASAGEGGAAGLGGAGGIRKVSTGTLTLNAANTFSGGMLIDGGSVVMGNEFALQNSTVTLNVDNGLNLSGRARVTLGGLEGTGALGYGATTLTVGGNNASTTYGGVLSGTGRLFKRGTGTLTLTGIGSSLGVLGVLAYFNGGTTLITGATTGSSYATLTTGGVQIAEDAGMVATVTVSGTDGNGNASSLSTGGSILWVGFRGTGTLNVLNGGQVSNGGTAYLGYLTGSSGTMTVSGTDGNGNASSWSTGSSILVVGNEGTGTLNVLDGGSVTSGGTVSIGNFAGSLGTATISGAGSSWSAGGNSLTVGFNGTGALNILDGGSVTTTGETRLARGSGSASLIVNGGRLTTDRLSVGSGTASPIRLTNPAAANGGGYALNLGGSNGSSTIGISITDAAAGEGGAAGVGGAGGIRKSGTGTLTLTGANTYSGGTLIEGGTVVAHGGAITGTTLSSGGLGTGAVTIAAGATLSVGQAANATVGTALTGGFQTLSVSSLTLTGSTGGSATPLLTFNLGATGSTDGSTNDLLRFSGDANSLAFSGSGTFAIGFASASGTSIVGPRSYLLMSFATPLSAGNVSLAEPNARFTAVGTGNLAGTPRGASFSWQTDGGGQITGLLFGTSGAEAVPEPGTLALVFSPAPALPVLGAVAARRRRKVASAITA